MMELNKETLTGVVIVIAFALLLGLLRGESLQPPHVNDSCNSLSTFNPSEFKDEYSNDTTSFSAELLICLDKKPYTIDKFYDSDGSEWRIVVNQSSKSLVVGDGSKEILQDARLAENNLTSNPFRNVWKCTFLVMQAGSQLNCQDTANLTKFLNDNSENISKAADTTSSLSTILKRQGYIEASTANGIKQIAKLAKRGVSEDVLFYADVFTTTSCVVGDASALEAINFAQVGVNLMDRIQQGSFYDDGLDDVTELSNGLADSGRTCNLNELKDLAQMSNAAWFTGSTDYDKSSITIEMYKSSADDAIRNITEIKNNEAPTIFDWIVYQYSSLTYDTHTEGINAYFNRGLYVSAKKEAMTTAEYYANWRNNEGWQIFILIIEIGLVARYLEGWKQ